MDTQRPLRVFPYIMASYVMVLLVSNLLSSAKIVVLGLNIFDFTIVPPFELSAGTVFFPLSYIYSDILTEVYGYVRAKAVIWMGFFAMAFMIFAIELVRLLPAASHWQYHEAYAQILGNVLRVNLASILAVQVGEFFNAAVLSKMKAMMGGDKRVGTRFIASTVVGQAFDTLIFMPTAFAGVLPNEVLVRVMLCSWIFKVLWEVIALPVTVRITRALKAVEGIDVVDNQVSYNPFGGLWKFLMECRAAASKT